MQNTSFEQLKCWQESRKLVNEIYTITDLPSLAKDYALKDQMRRAAISIMSNIAEGYGRNGNKEFIQFLSVARGSAFELQAQLYIAVDNKYISEQHFQSIKDQCYKTSNLINGLIKYLKNEDNPVYKLSDNPEVYNSNS